MLRDMVRSPLELDMLEVQRADWKQNLIFAVGPTRHLTAMISIACRTNSFLDLLFALTDAIMQTLKFLECLYFG